MIRYTCPEDAAIVTQIAQQDSIFGPDILARLGVYGCGTPAADFWLVEQAQAQAVLCREGGLLRIATPAPAQLDAEELRPFFAILGGFGAVFAEAGLCTRLASGAAVQSAPAMQYTGGFSGKDFSCIRKGLPLDALFSLLFPEAIHPNKTSKARWYTYTSHLFRHGLGFAAAVYVDEQPVSTGGIYAWSETAGLLACIATAPAHQHRGYAQQLIQYLCDHVLAQGKTPILLCANDALENYYAQLGFAPYGRWGRWTI